MKLYVVQNHQGKYFRPIGMNGTGEQWQDSLEKAKFYGKIGPAKAQCTFWYTHYPEFSCPQILEFELNPHQATIIDVSKEATKSIDKKKKKEEEREKINKAQSALRNQRTI